jgi:hypothetical protein
VDLGSDLQSPSHRAPQVFSLANRMYHFRIIRYERSNVADPR